MNTTLKNGLTFLATAFALLGAPALHAQLLTFDVDLNTAALNSQNSANAPFYLDLQLNYGSTPQPSSTVTLSDFQFTGGNALGSATTSGSASGSLGSTVSLTASSSSQFNELFQQFSSSTTDINFHALVSESGAGTVPTEFATAIFDNSLGSPAPLFTSAPDTQSLVLLNLNPTNTMANVGAFTSISSADGNTPVTGISATITPVPEPSTTAAILGGAVLLFAFCARRFRRLPLAGTPPSPTFD